jgi:hypothetical protein
VRSTVWTLVIFVVVCIGFTALIAWLTESNWFGPRAAARDVRVLADPVGFILGTGIGLGQLAIGTMIRHTAGSISTIIGVVFVLPILTGLLPSSWGAHINAYLPERAGILITHTHQTADDLLSPSQGFGVLCIWTVLALAVAAYLLEHRDA